MARQGFVGRALDDGRHVTMLVTLVGHVSKTTYIAAASRSAPATTGASVENIFPSV